jgi:hypothetical protein
MTGDSVTLTCAADLPEGVTGTPSFQWEGPGGGVTTVSDLESTLVIDDAQLSHAGQYMCTVTISFFNVNESIAIIVQIESPTPSIVGSRSLPLYAGTLYSLTCDHELHEAIESSAVEWTVNGGAVNTSPGRVSVVNESLVFSPVAVSDSGSYSCSLSVVAREYVVIANPQQDTPPVDIIIEDLPPPDVATNSDSQLAIGDQLDLECSVSVAPFLATQPSLRWVRDGATPLASGDGETLSYQLAVDQTSVAGEYTCQVTVEVPEIGLSVTRESETVITVQSKLNCAYFCQNPTS